MSAISKQQRVKGEAFLSEAESTLAKKTWFASSSEQKHEDAAELYCKAANAFKVGGFFTEAGDAYGKAAKIYQDKLKNGMEASKALTESGEFWAVLFARFFRRYVLLSVYVCCVLSLRFAYSFVLFSTDSSCVLIFCSIQMCTIGHCYKKIDAKKAIEAFRESISMLCDAGRLTQAARLSKETAELFENDGGEDSIALAIESYQQAADLYDMEQQRSQASQCIVKVAELSSAALDPPQFMRAAELYEKLGKDCLESNLLKYNAKSYFLQSLLCHLANQDVVGAEKSMRMFSSLDFTFSESREGKFAEELITCVNGYDSEGFATACFEYDRISKLDPWKTTVLLSVKKSVEGGEGGDIEDDIDLT